MENKETAMIPYYVHEGEISRLERLNKRLWILILVIFISLIGTNAGWIIYESQYEDIVVTQDVDTGEGTAVVSGTGNAIYGESQTDSADSGEENQLKQSDETMP